MTAAITPDPQATRPELGGPIGDGELVPGAWPSRGSGTASLRVGVAMVWLSVIVLLPLAAIAWQAAGAGMDLILCSGQNPSQGEVALASLESHYRNRTLNATTNFESKEAQ